MAHRNAKMIRYPIAAEDHPVFAKDLRHRLTSAAGMVADAESAVPVRFRRPWGVATYGHFGGEYPARLLCRASPGLVCGRPAGGGFVGRWSTIYLPDTRRMSPTRNVCLTSRRVRGVEGSVAWLLPVSYS